METPKCNGIPVSPKVLALSSKYRVYRPWFFGSIEPVELGKKAVDKDGCADGHQVDDSDYRARRGALFGLRLVTRASKAFTHNKSERDIVFLQIMVTSKMITTTMTR